jgi:hypothetical protein
LLFRRWQLRLGREWEPSVEAADPDDGYFDENLRVAYDALLYDPWSHSHALTGGRDTLRVWWASDSAAGYNLFVFLEIHEAERVVEFKWVDREDH